MTTSSNPELPPEATVLMHLKLAEMHLNEAVLDLTKETEYLRDELETQRALLEALFSKIDREEALLRDREAVHAGMLENVGVPDAEAGD